MSLEVIVIKYEERKIDERITFSFTFLHNYVTIASNNIHYRVKSTCNNTVYYNILDITMNNDKHHPPLYVSYGKIKHFIR